MGLCNGFKKSAARVELISDLNASSVYVVAFVLNAVLFWVSLAPLPVSNTDRSLRSRSVP